MHNRNHDDGWDEIRAALKRSNDRIEPSESLRRQVADHLGAHSRASSCAATSDALPWYAAVWPRVRSFSAVAAALMITIGLTWLALPENIGPQPEAPPSTTLVNNRTVQPAATVVVRAADESTTIVRPIHSTNDNITIVWFHNAAPTHSDT